ncbi:uncharacterized protein M6B38_407780 [Iris pallida]|uniref:Rhodanese domain-containing protein n=1 Tax=Iris pallida TaxID=29817 RepID=A0AAX6FQA1_IRIPA|nr:uncharacterized protein M6B38_407780 [Iris pallida]
MDMLDSLPMEAHALRYSATVAALLFAAIGLWRIRVACPPSPSPRRPGPSPPDTPRMGPAVVSTPRAAPSPSCRTAAEAGEAGMPPKTRFTAYFHAEDDHRLGSLDIPKTDTFYGAPTARVRNNKSVQTFQNTLAVRRKLRNIPSSSYLYVCDTENHASDDLTEVALKRGRDLGWYRAQNLSALDGSVVKLWDGGLCK